MRLLRDVAKLIWDVAGEVLPLAGGVAATATGVLVAVYRPDLLLALLAAAVPVGAVVVWLYFGPDRNPIPADTEEGDDLDVDAWINQAAPVVYGDGDRR